MTTSQKGSGICRGARLKNEQLRHKVLLALNDATYKRSQPGARRRNRPMSTAAGRVLDEVLLYTVPDSRAF